jgi:NAD(P)-dependent dehydrogenase (short-subunit alcohol dehydrogenase family)
VAAWIEAAAPTLVIANAGISAGPGTNNVESPAQIRAVFATNVDGVFNTVLPAMTVMQKLPKAGGGMRGRIVIIGSIAGLIASPASPAYSAAKAALDFWVTAAAPNAAKDGIGLTIVRPGFIRTPMTAGNPYKMPGLMDADQAARIIIRGIEKGRTHVTFPAWFAAFARFGNLVPKSLLANLPKKPAT